MGYAGGTRPRRPTYESIGDHTEVFQVDFDPQRISYEALLERFWASHDPTSPPWSTQYRNLILVADAEQRRSAEASRAAQAKKLGKQVLTPLEDLGTFTRAEDYHQKFVLRQYKDVLADLRRTHPGEAFVDTTAAARLNAYLSGYGEPERLEGDLERFALSDAAADTVRRRFLGRKALRCGN